MPFEIDRTLYARLYGPTTGDRVRLGDTNLLVEVERDETAYGDEALWGFGKTNRSTGACRPRPSRTCPLRSSAARRPMGTKSPRTSATQFSRPSTRRVSGQCHGWWKANSEPGRWT